MRRRLNVRLLLGLIGTLAVGGVGVHLGHGYQAQHNAGALLRQADRALEEDNLDRAVTYLSHYLIYEPGDTDALAKYGLTLDKLAQSGSARLQVMLVLEEVLRRDPDKKDVRFRLVHCLIHLGKDRLPEAIQNLEVLLPDWTNPGELEHMLGWCHEAHGNYARAVHWFHQAMAQAPQRIETYVLLAEVLQTKLDQADKADLVMDALVEANANSFQAYLARARFHKERGAQAEGEKDIRRALELAPEDEGVLLAAADWAQAKGNLPQARQIVERALALHPRNEDLYKALASLELRSGRRQQAVACLRRGLQELPQARDLLIFLAELLIDLDHWTESRQKLDQLRQAGPDPMADYLQARLLIAGGKWIEATDLLEKVRADLPAASAWSSKVDVLLGSCYEQVGDFDRQRAACARALAHNPGWTAGRLRLGLALVNAGRVEDALTEFRLAQEAADAPANLWLPFTRVLMLHNIRLPAKEREWDAVEEALAKAVTAEPDAADIPILRAQMLVARKKFHEAAALLRLARDQKPDEVVFWCAQADVATQQQQWDSAAKILDNAEKRLSDRVELRLARGRLWAARGGPTARQALLSLAQKLDAFTPEEQIRLLRVLAETLHQLGDGHAAGDLWRELARRQPRDLRSRFGLFELALKNHQENEAAALLADIRRLEGKTGYLGRYAQAALLVQEARHGDGGKLTEASQLLTEVARRQGNWPRVPLLEAKIAELQGNTDRAIDHYLLALGQGERQPHLVLRLVRLLFERRRILEADQVLRNVEETGPLGPDLARLGAEIALANQEPERALRLAREAVNPVTHDYRDLLWLAQIFHAAADDAAAEQKLRRAVQLAGHAPDTWVALVGHLARTGHTAAAETVLAEAERKLPSDRALLCLARCHEVLGRLDRAEELFRHTRADRPSDFIVLYSVAEFFLRTDQPAKAEPCLRKLTSQAVAAPAEHVAWARRQLAINLAYKGSADNYREAMILLRKNVRDWGKNVADDRARALVLGTLKDKRRLAVDLFESTLARWAVTVDEQFDLVKLYTNAGENSKARDWLVGLMASHGDNPQYLAFFIGSLLKNGQASDALLYLNRLERLEPNSARTRELKTAVRKALAEAALL